MPVDEGPVETAQVLKNPSTLTGHKRGMAPGYVEVLQGVEPEIRLVVPTRDNHPGRERHPSPGNESRENRQLGVGHGVNPNPWVP